MYHAVNLAEASLISSLLRKATLKLSLLEKCSLAKLNGVHPSQSGAGEDIMRCEEMADSMNKVKWLSDKFEGTARQLIANQGTYDTIVQIVKHKRLRDKCVHTETEAIDENEEEEESVLVAEEEKPFQYEDVKASIANQVIVYKKLASRYQEAKDSADLDILDHIENIQVEKTKLENDLERIKRAVVMEDYVWGIQNNFLKGEIIKRDEDKEEKRKSFEEEKIPTLKDISRLREELEQKKIDYYLMVKDCLHMRRVVKNHEREREERAKNTQSEELFTSLQAWWRGCIVRMKMGGFEAMFNDMAEQIVKRKQEEAKSAKKLKNKYSPKK